MTETTSRGRAARSPGWRVAVNRVLFWAAWVGIVAVASVASGVGPAVAIPTNTVSDIRFAAKPAGSAVGLRKGPYLVYPGSNTQMRVLWQSDGTPANPSYMEWGPTPACGLRSAALTESGPGADEHQFSYLITGLTPGALCYYRVTVDTNTWGGSFGAAPASTASNVTFYAFGDTRTYPDRMAGVTAAMLRDMRAAPGQRQTFALHVGDWVVTGGIEAAWQKEFFNRSYESSVDFLARVPIMGCRGNHDCIGGTSLMSKYWPYHGQEGYYSFDYGPVHVTVVDQYVTYAEGSAQYVWFTNDLAQATQHFKMALFHEPAYSALGGHPNNTTAQTVLCPVLARYGVHAAVVGHNHLYAHCFTNGIHHITCGGGGAPLATPELNSPALVTAESAYQFARFDVSNTVMTVTVVRTNDTVIETFQVPPSQ